MQVNVIIISKICKNCISIVCSPRILGEELINISIGDLKCFIALGNFSFRIVFSLGTVAGGFLIPLYVIEG